MSGFDVKFLSFLIAQSHQFCFEEGEEKRGGGLRRTRGAVTSFLVFKMNIGPQKSTVQWRCRGKNVAKTLAVCKPNIECLFMVSPASWCKLYCCHANQSDKTHQKPSWILTNQSECNLQSQFAPTSKLIVIWLVWKFIQSSQSLRF